ncbi:MAG TPA: nicotinate (nicotinamide) nucleotide adenylyltransferase [Humisphaera sp.]
MRTLCFGGSFNPIHHGHLLVARAAAEAAGFGQILLIPSAQPPHKPAGPDLASASDRLTMCQLAVQGMAGFTVSDLELKRATPSYTLETARLLRQSGLPEVAWLIGADTVPQLRKWHQPEQLLKEVQFVVVRRPGTDMDWSAVEPPYRHLKDHVVDAPLIDVSATEIRNRVRAGKPIDFFTPPAVVEYIRDRGLYR